MATRLWPRILSAPLVLWICACGNAGATPGRDPGGPTTGSGGWPVGASGGGTSAAGGMQAAGAGGAASTGGAAFAGGTGAGGIVSGAGGAAGGSPPAPLPVDACGTDPDAQEGVVRPDFGEPQNGEAFTGDPNADGPFGVLVANTSIPNPDASRPVLDATFYAPSSDGGSTAVDGEHPLVLVMHGFGVTHRFYEHFSRHLATHGLLVLGITLPGSLVAVHDKNAEEARAALDFALGVSAPAQVQGRADPERIAVIGHSFGGKIAFYAAATDPRIDLVIGWDPSNAGGPPCFIDPNGCNRFPVAPNCLAKDSGMVHRLQAETVVFRAAPDGANPEPAHNAIHFYRGAPAPATLIDYDNRAAHGDFANAAATIIPHTRRVQLAFLLTRLSGRTGLDAYLPGGSAIAQDSRVVRVLFR